MKRLASILLALTLALCACASAESGVTIDEMVKRNDLATVLEGMKGIGINIVYYDQSGAEEVSFYECVWKQPDGSLRYAHEDDDGSVEIVGGGEGIGFSAPDKRFYMMGFVGDTYEAFMADYYDVFLLNIDGGETALRCQSADGRVVLTTTEPIEGQYDGFDGCTLETEHALNADTLLLEQLCEYAVSQNGERTLLCKAWTTPDKTYDIPAEFDEAFKAEQKRTVHIIAHAGTEDAFDYVFETPKDVMIKYVLPVDCAVYLDAACVTPYTGIPADKDGALPDDVTLYMGRADRLAGAWASIGSQDGMPALYFYPDGTMEAIGYEGDIIISGAYAYNPDTGAFTFPDGDAWTMGFSACDRELLLSQSTIGDDPIPLGTRIMEFTRDPQHDMDDGWMAYAYQGEIPEDDGNG